MVSRWYKDCDYYIMCVTPGGIADRSGEVAINDTIISINGNAVQEVAFEDVRGMFIDCSYTVRLRLKRHGNKPRRPALV